MSEFLEESKTALHSNCEFVWIDEQTLEKQNVQSFSDLPFWVPSSSPEYAGFMEFDCSKAIAAGLTIRPLAETVRHTCSWDNDRDPNIARAVGLSLEREAEVLNLTSEPI